MLQNNQRHNQERPTYADPTLYKGGLSYDSPDPKPLDLKIGLFKDFLSTAKPKSVLEIGPGTGHLTKYIVRTPSVNRYTAVDINNSFLNFLEPRLTQVKQARPEFQFNLVHGDINDTTLGSQKFDAIVFLSAVHHIPDRLKLFSSLSNLLNRDGRIYTQEPAHYLPRQQYLFKKFLRTYRYKVYWSDPKNYGTHHFCTMEEYAKITAALPELDIASCCYYRINFPLPALFKKGLTKSLLALGKKPEVDDTFSTKNPRSLLRFFADEIIVEVQRR